MSDAYHSAKNRVEELSREMFYAPRVFIGNGYLHVHIPMTSAVLTLGGAEEFRDKLDDLIQQLKHQKIIMDDLARGD
jgi:hypothetical protein